ncbi:cell wall hydrolase [Metabacillus sp. FJAT-53654]|uniref:Cell wall hydrolase n=1 Tax=Metabacillus rhizosphaerae TaxID=3117747 RepID=A0ABZ2MPU5_9BACI
MAVVKATEADVKLLARLMRAEAEGDGQLGMLMVGNVGVNRTRSGCLDFKEINTIRRMVFQRPGGFEATIKGYFYQGARELDIRLARRVINGERFHPASYSLWFFKPSGACPAQWYNQWNSVRFKAHCFYKPTESSCPDVYNTF